VVRCAELVGYFVRADIWCTLVLERVNTSQSPASLSVLAAVIRGSESSQLRAHLDDISAVISHPRICHVAEVHASSTCVILRHFIIVALCNRADHDIFIL